MRRASLLLPILLAACESTVDMRARAPDLSAVSAKPAQELVACVVEAWDRITVNIAAVNVRPISGGGSAVVIQELGVTTALLDVRPTPAGQQLAFYSTGMRLTSRPAAQAVEGCK